MIAVVNQGTDRYDRLGKGVTSSLRTTCVPNKGALSRQCSVLVIWQ